jgi:hypothetical protein
VAEALLPILRTFEVLCSGEHAFDTWTRRIGLWWPLAAHSVSGESAVGVSIEPWRGGRIFETTLLGKEIVWGTIEAWEPPLRFAYLWFIGEKDASYATLVTISFTALAHARTRVSIEQTGWEHAGPEAEAKHHCNGGGWRDLEEAFTRFLSKETSANR